MKINTGGEPFPLITLIGIWSISALTSLPGLAVSPILGQLSTTFPDASELDIQMLSSLPSLLIIPFILLAGKLTEKRDFVRLLRGALDVRRELGAVPVFHKNVAINSCRAPCWNWCGTDYSAFYRIDFPLFHGNLPGETIWIQFRHYKCYAGGGNRCYRLSGRSELASAFPGSFTTFGSHHTHHPSERRKCGW